MGLPVLGRSKFTPLNHTLMNTKRSALTETANEFQGSARLDSKRSLFFVVSPGSVARFAAIAFSLQIRLWPGSFLRAASVTGGFVVDVSSREQVRSFYNAVYSASEGVPIDSTADVTNCIPGTNSTAFTDVVLRRVNWFRALAGIPASVTFDATNSAKAQQAALIMAANGALSVAPPPSWTCYTANGAQAAGNANLALGFNGCCRSADNRCSRGILSFHHCYQWDSRTILSSARSIDSSSPRPSPIGWERGKPNSGHGQMHVRIVFRLIIKPSASRPRRRSRPR